MNILLAYPSYSYESVSTFEEPVGILYLASSLLAAGFRVDVADLTFNPTMTDFEEKVRWADVAGISISTPTYGTAVSVLGYVKRIRPAIFAVAGGPHVTARPADALNAGFDACVIGEGEQSAKELFAALENNRSLENVAGIAYRDSGEIRMTAARGFIQHLDAIPFPARQFIDYSKYRRIGVICMRGCPYRCIYCKPVEDMLFGRKLRRRSAENVAEEIAVAVKAIGKRPISFKDDTLTVNNTEWFVQLREELSRRNLKIRWQCSSRVDSVTPVKLKAMKAAGCQQIFFGIESGAQRILDYYRKDIRVEDTKKAFEACRRAGIRACASIMLGAPVETRQDLEQTYQLVKEIRPFNWHVHITTPICGSYLHDQAKAERRLSCPEDFSNSVPTGNLYRLVLPMKLDFLTKADIAEYRDRINTYMKIRLLLNCLRDPSLWREFVLSRGFRIIALNFLRRHFNFRRLQPAQPAGRVRLQP